MVVGDWCTDSGVGSLMPEILENVGHLGAAVRSIWGQQPLKAAVGGEQLVRAVGECTWCAFRGAMAGMVDG